MKTWIGAAGIMVLLGACGGGGTESGLTAEEERQLNEAGAMLDDANELAAPDEEDNKLR